MKRTVKISEVDFFNEKAIFEEGPNVEPMVSIAQIWNNLQGGKVVYWGSKHYRLTMSEAHCEYQDNHFTNKNGFVLRVTCTKNWFGSLLVESEIGKCFTNEKYQ